jgi:hypothetical protein
MVEDNYAISNHYLEGLLVQMHPSHLNIQESIIRPVMIKKFLDLLDF